MATTVEFVQNKEPFLVTGPHGEPRVVQRGEVVSVKDWAYKGREHLFETMEEHAVREATQRSQMGMQPPVERATAAPGEKREVHIPQSSEGITKTTPGYPCDFDGCEFASTTERGLKIHRRVHDDEGE